MTCQFLDIATIIRGVTFDKNEAIDNAAPGHLPVLRAGNIGVDLVVDRDLVWVPESRIANEQRMQVNDIAICMSSGSQSVVGKSATLKAPWQGSVGAFCALIRPRSEQVVPEYLSLFLQSEVFRRWTRQSSGANIKNIRKSELESFPIALPSVAEQRRIVDLLTHAESIVRLRREAAAKAAELIPAIFVNMFGDPKTNSKGLAVRKVADVVARFEGGKNIQAGDGEASDLRILKVSAVTSGAYLEAECKPAPNDYVAPPRHLVQAGDMLFSRANTSELVGATALVEQTNGSTLLPDKLWRIVWREEVDSLYMWALFQSKAVRQELSKLASGTSDSMRNISQAKLFELALPVAALNEQKHFGEIAKAARSIQKQQDMALEKAQATFNALLAQAFSPPTSSASTQE